MKNTRSSASDPGVANRNPLPGSKKVYLAGSRGIRVPMREILLHPTPGLEGSLENNAPVRLYDTSGPYTDPDIEIDLQRGLPELRKEWILERGPYELGERCCTTLPAQEKCCAAAVRSPRCITQKRVL